MITLLFLRLLSHYVSKIKKIRAIYYQYKNLPLVLTINFLIEEDIWPNRSAFTLLTYDLNLSFKQISPHIRTNRLSENCREEESDRRVNNQESDLHLISFVCIGFIITGRHPSPGHITCLSLSSLTPDSVKTSTQINQVQSVLSHQYTRGENEAAYPSISTFTKTLHLRGYNHRKILSPFSNGSFTFLLDQSQ